MASNGVVSKADRLKQIQKAFDPGMNRRSGHLVNISMATLKDVMMHAESDDLRLQAAQTLLSLAPVQRKLEYQCEAVLPPQMDRKSAGRASLLGARVKRLVDTGNEHASEVLRLIEQAELEAGLPANPRPPARNPLSE